jgi:pimeloyl-ACP methyl ester carboxylesterase
MPRVKSTDAEIQYDVHDETRGRGEALLCIMGLGGASNWWFPQVEGLRDSYRVITFDNRGVGRSDKPAGPYSMSQMAADALAVLDAAGANDAHVMGISMGGMIAQHVALTAPRRVKKLVLACTTAGGPTALQPNPEVLSALMAIGGMRPDSPAEMIEKLGWIVFPREWLAVRGRELVALLEANAMEPAPQHAFLAQVMAIAGHDTRGRLPEIQHETLVLTGDVDVLVPPANSRILSDGLPKATLHTIPGTGHGFNVQEPEAYNRAVKAFLAA